MTTLRAIFTAFAPEYLEHYPPCPPHTEPLGKDNVTRALSALRQVAKDI